MGTTSLWDRQRPRLAHSSRPRAGKRGRRVVAVTVLLVSASLVSVPAVGAAAQSLPAELPQPVELPAEDVEGGLVSDDDLGLPSLEEDELDGAPPLGDAVDEVGLLDLLGPDGTYTLNDSDGDGDGEILLRLLDSADAAFTGADQAGLAGLAASAASAYAAGSNAYAAGSNAYAAGSNATVSSDLATPSNWLVSDSGQLFLLVGGVNVVFSSHLSEADISAILVSHGVAIERVEPLGELPNAFLIETVSDAESLRLAGALAAEVGVDSAVPNLFTPLSLGPEPLSLPYPRTTARTESRCTPYTEPYPDELSACLWHLNADTDYRFYTADPTIDVNLGDVWDTTMGAGVTVAVVDHTWEATHEDISANVDAARSQIWGGFTGENQNARTPYHGTAVAGIVGARDNTVGGRGVAPRATLVNYNFLDHQSRGIEVAALTLNKETVAVDNLSYGTVVKESTSSQGSLWRRAVEEGLNSGFGGKGSSYVKAPGNNADIAGADWATLEESNNHRGVISACSRRARWTTWAGARPTPRRAPACGCARRWGATGPIRGHWRPSARTATPMQSRAPAFQRRWCRA